MMSDVKSRIAHISFVSTSSNQSDVCFGQERRCDPDYAHMKNNRISEFGWTHQSESKRELRSLPVRAARLNSGCQQRQRMWTGWPGSNAGKFGKPDL